MCGVGAFSSGASMKIREGVKILGEGLTECILDDMGRYILIVHSSLGSFATKRGEIERLTA